MFADRAKIFIKSGKGGDGHVSFRREKYVPNGGPNGGDGGNGGDIIFVVDEGLNTLTDFRHIRKYVAQPGEDGGTTNKHGKNGESLWIKVPLGTIIKDAETDKIIADMSDSSKQAVILRGGRGGKGNQHYATPTMQAPKYAQPGGDGREMYVNLELKVIADVGLVGYPNVGKSTLLSRVSNAKPKIANYHFTTLHPNLGVVDLDGSDGFVIADIPGLIEGASEGVGLGHEFLRHIERTKVLIHIVDAASTEGRNPIDDIEKITYELENYKDGITDKPWVIAANKMDALYEGADNPLDVLKEKYEPLGIKVFPISAVSGKGVKELLYYVNDMLKNMDDAPVVFEQEYDPMAVNPLEQLPFTVEKEEEGIYRVEGPRIERMLGYTNLESEKGFHFFQKFMKENGILDQLEELGIQEEDTVCIYGFEFDYYKE